MTHHDAIREHIAAEIATDVRPDEIPFNEDLLEVGLLDSLSMVRLIAWLGERFAIPINDLDLAPDDFRTVEKIDAFIEAHRGSVAA